jgi:hypothetical protein
MFSHIAHFKFTKFRSFCAFAVKMDCNANQTMDKKRVAEMYHHEETTTPVQGAPILKVPDLNKVSS